MKISYLIRIPSKKMLALIPACEGLAAFGAVEPG